MAKKSFAELTTIFREATGAPPEMTDEELLKIRLGRIQGFSNRSSSVFTILFHNRGVKVGVVVCNTYDTVREFLEGIEKNQY